MPRTVLMVSGNGPPVIDGVGHYTARLVAGLESARPNWRWLWLRRKRRWFTRPFARWGRVLVVQPWHAWTQFGIRAAAAVARSLRPDLLHIQEQTHSFHESSAAPTIAAALPRRRVITTVHEVHPELSGYRWTQALMDRTQRVLTNDAVTAEKCTRHLGRDPDGILWSPANVLPPTGELLPRRPGLVVTFGFLSAIKGIEPLFQALSRLRETVPELRWRIVGPFFPDRDPHHAALASRLRGDWIEFTGDCDDLDAPQLRRWLAEASVMALPFADGASARRGTLQTAWAFGIPVVTTPPRVRDAAVAPGVNCLVAPLERLDLWEAAVHDVLTNPTLANVLSAGSRATAATFSWQRLVAEHLRLYDQLIDEFQLRGRA